MSSDPELERLLRDAGATIPGPRSGATSRARDAALAALRGPRSRKRQASALLGIGLVLALASGIGVGALVTARGEAAKGPVGLGFVPERGWFALQSSGDGSPVYQTIAVASNVPFAAEDDVAGQSDGSGLPYATLLDLPESGIVIVASFLRESELLRYLGPSASGQRGVYPLYPDRNLPLCVRNATPFIQNGTQIRPDAPLGQYQLRAAVNGYYVDLQFYFGALEPSEAQLEQAQRQLDGLVVGGRQVQAAAARTEGGATATAQSVTFSFSRFFDVACNCFEARVSGRVSSGRAGEYVVVLEEFCGRGSGRSVVAATTREGGVWDAVIDIVMRPDSTVAVSYRARWNETLSEPVSFKGKLVLAGKRLNTGMELVTVVTPEFNPVNLKGRQVLLQRRVRGTWKRVAAARLAPHRTRFYTFAASFGAVRRGWTVRALVPAKAAAPCFVASPSEQWIS